MRKFWHVMYWLSIPLVILAGILVIVAAYFAGDKGMNMTALFVISGVTFFLAIALPVFANTVGLKPTKADKERFAKYLSYTADNNVDYKKELETIKANFKADETPDKNVFKIGRLPPIMEHMKDFSVLDKGEICYGYIMLVSGALIRGKGTYINDAYPANVIYSGDPYFESDPLELKAIAARVFGDSGMKLPPVVGKNGFPVYENLPLDKKATGGREVYLKSIEIQLDQLPLLRLTNRLIPVIAEPEKDYRAAFVVDCKYWTDNFIGDFLNGKQGASSNQSIFSKMPL